MAGITSAIATSFKVELLEGDHDFNNGADAFKCALFKANASITGTYDASTTNYSVMTGNSDELAATGGYSTNGNTLTKKKKRKEKSKLHHNSILLVLAVLQVAL